MNVPIMQPSKKTVTINTVPNVNCVNSAITIIGKTVKDKSPSAVNNDNDSLEHYSSVVTANDDTGDDRLQCQKLTSPTNANSEDNSQHKLRTNRTNERQKRTDCVGDGDGSGGDFGFGSQKLFFNSFLLATSSKTTTTTATTSKCLHCSRMGGNVAYFDSRCSSVGLVSHPERIQPSSTICEPDRAIDHNHHHHNACCHRDLIPKQHKQYPNCPAYFHQYCNLNHLNSILQSPLRLLLSGTSSSPSSSFSSFVSSHPYHSCHHNHHHNRHNAPNEKKKKKKNCILLPNQFNSTQSVQFVLFLLLLVFGLISFTVSAGTTARQSDDGMILNSANGTLPLNGNPHRHHAVTIHSELITAESIYPCLDIFDVILARPGIDHGLSKQTNAQTNVVDHNQPSSPQHPLPSVNSNYDQIRQLIRVYWATKEVVDSIQWAATQHLSRKRLYPLSSSHHHHHHHPQHQHHRNHHHNHRKHLRVHSSIPADAQTRHHHLHASLPRRPSMLIELRQLNYVREYVVPLKSRLMQMRCDQFEPGESLYYCFIHVILSGNAVQYESLPHCVPTMLNVPFNQTNSNSDPTRHHSRINNQQTTSSATSKFGVSSNAGKSSVSSSQADPNESTQKFLNDSPLNTLVDTKHGERENGPIGPTLSILPPGPSFNNLASNIVPKTTAQDNDYHLHKLDGASFESEIDKNIKQFALKSDQDEQQPQNPYGNIGKNALPIKRQILVQTQFCHCRGKTGIGSNADKSNNDGAKLIRQNLVRINLTETETMILHLIITSCSIGDGEDYSGVDYYDGDYTSANYISPDDSYYESSNNGDDEKQTNLINSKESNVQLSIDQMKESTVTTTTLENIAHLAKDNETHFDLEHSKDKDNKKQSSSNNKRKNKKQNNHQQQLHKKRRKGKKEKKTNQKQPQENNNNVTTTTTTVVQPMVELTASTTEASTETISGSSVSPVTTESSSLDPTICILSIDNPIDYSFKLDSIEPSYDLPLDRLNDATNGFQSTINLIDYLHKFPFLVVRNGQLSIDPRMNIENRSQTHYFRSGHLRFEAISSMNVTIRFRRSASLSRPVAPTPSRRSLLNQFKQTDELIGNKDQKSLTTEQQSSGYLDTFHSITKQIVSFIALKIIDVDQKNSRKLNEYKNGSMWSMSNLSSFHLTAIILSLFIAITLFIYAVIALDGKNKRHRLLVQTTTIALSNKTTKNGSQIKAGTTAIEKGREAVVSIKKCDSLGSFSLSEPQSLELDYYDYSQPLSVENSTGRQIQLEKENSTQGPNYANMTAVVEINSRSELQTKKINNYRNGTNTPVIFRTLPIKVSSNSSNNNTLNRTKLSTNISTFSLDTPNPNNDSTVSCNNNENGNNNVATLTRLSFTKPPILLSTFARKEE